MLNTLITVAIKELPRGQYMNWTGKFVNHILSISGKGLCGLVRYELVLV